MMTQPGPVAEPSAPAPAPGPPYDQRIRDLAARWELRGPDVLHGLDLDVRAGQRVAVVGPSGSGKTTLAMLLLRFLDPAAGTVTLGGTDITALDSDAVRRIIGLCAQDPHIFDSTLEANLRLALARVLLADFPVVILDEPAEHLDEDTGPS